jgi:hypothetical protein
MKTSFIRQKGIYLHVYLGAQKARWIDYCNRHGEKPGAAVKRIIAALMSQENRLTTITNEVIDKPDRSRKRLEVRLTMSEYALIDQLAESDGLTVSQYLVNLARAHMLKKPQFGSADVEALAESNYQLLALGRNLNQIARALNAEDPDEHRPTVKEIKALTEKIYHHTHMVSNLIASNLERWKIE